jgi:hypothetical protein
MDNNWEKSWKGRIAKFIFETYNNRENDSVSDHFFSLTIDQLLWHATTIIKDDEKLINIKYVGQRYWSENAIKHYCELNPLKGKGFKACKNLRHEHAVPRIMIKEKIKKSLKENTSIYEIYEILNTYSKSVIITIKEDKNLPKENKIAFSKWNEINSDFETAFLGEKKELEGKGFIDFMEDNRYKKQSNGENEIKIIDLYDLESIQDLKMVPYEKVFKELMHEINKNK